MSKVGKSGRAYKTISVGNAIEIAQLAVELEKQISEGIPEFVENVKFNFNNIYPEVEGVVVANSVLKDLPTGDGVLVWFPVQRMGDVEGIGSYLPQGPIPIGIGSHPTTVGAAFLSTPLETISPKLAGAIYSKLSYENGAPIPGDLIKSSMSRSYLLWFQKEADGKIQTYRIDDSANFFQEAILETTRFKLLRKAQQSDDTANNLAMRSLHFSRLSDQYVQQLRQKNLKFELDALMRARSISERNLLAANEALGRARRDAQHNKGLEGFSMIFGMMDIASGFAKLGETYQAKADYNESAADRSHEELQSIDINIINIYVEGLGVDQNTVPQPSIPNPWKL